MILNAALAYLSCGLIVALWATTTRSSEDMDHLQWAALIVLWPVFLCLALWRRRPRPRLAALEVMVWKRIVSLAVRRIRRHGYDLEINRE